MSEELAADLGTEWQQAMLAGDFERAWRASDAIRALGLPDPHRFWQGEDFAGKRVMLRCLHGFGDSVQFLRYVPRLQELAASVCVEVAPRFAELARCLDGVADVVTWEEPAPEWDVQMEVTELPYVFRTTLQELPIAERYLRVPGAREERRTGLLRVGLVWTAGEWNQARSVGWECLRPLLGVGGCEFWNLETVEASGGVLRDDVRCRESLLGLAERVARLDLVVTVDTLAAHVAGAMGVPAWVMLQEEADWRWMRVREDSPWYPSLRLFRQGVQGDWAGVVERVGRELRKVAEA